MKWKKNIMSIITIIVIIFHDIQPIYVQTLYVDYYTQKRTNQTNFIETIENFDYEKLCGYSSRNKRIVSSL